MNALSVKVSFICTKANVLKNVLRKLSKIIKMNAKIVTLRAFNVKEMQ